MGLTLTLPDFGLIAKRPLPVLVGVRPIPNMMTPSAQCTPGASGLKVAGVIIAAANAARMRSGKTVTAMRALRSSEDSVGGEDCVETESDVDISTIFHRSLNCSLPHLTL